MPTYQSEPVIARTLDHLTESLQVADLELGRLIIVDNESDDGTIDTIESVSEEYGWETDVTRRESSLPAAREMVIANVETEWFLFLDDDVRIAPDYLETQLECIAPRVGAVQGRKASNTETPHQWVRRRVNRGGTHATLLRRQAVSDLDLPDDLVVLEDEFIRQHVTEQGYLWLFDHQAEFDHESMERHSIDWQQGYLAGKYDLLPGYVLLMAIGEAMVSDKRLLPRVERLFGWAGGRVVGRRCRER
jgi:glycosyltransferase involved in cell wall biosynthesis